MSMNVQSQLSTKDFVNMLLADEKRTAGEYATATLEASNQVVHQTFSQMLQSSLQTQREVFNLMNQQGWYSAPATAQSADIQKQMTQATQTVQQLQQMTSAQGLGQQGRDLGQTTGLNHSVMEQVMASSPTSEPRQSNQRPM